MLLRSTMLALDTRTLEATRTISIPRSHRFRTLRTQGTHPTSRTLFVRSNREVSLQSPTIWQQYENSTGLEGWEPEAMLLLHLLKELLVAEPTLQLNSLLCKQTSLIKPPIAWLAPSRLLLH